MHCRAERRISRLPLQSLQHIVQRDYPGTRRPASSRASTKWIVSSAAAKRYRSAATPRSVSSMNVFRIELRRAIVSRGFAGGVAGFCLCALLGGWQPLLESMQGDSLQEPGYMLYCIEDCLASRFLLLARADFCEATCRAATEVHFSLHAQQQLHCPVQRSWRREAPSCASS